jgi:hypothetical protein
VFLDAQLGGRERLASDAAIELLERQDRMGKTMSLADLCPPLPR